MRGCILLFAMMISIVSVFAESESMRLNDLGYQAYQKQQYDVASDLFYRAIQANKSNPYAHHNYACMLAINHWRSDIDIIIFHLQYEIDLDPNRMERILADHDLDGIRNTKEYSAFIKKNTK
ncbi:MAG: hypothetical protein JW904_06340 [Spirochaetales bacterium]|nr:hypothetical protein [Spirochaetales bacterium]